VTAARQEQGFLDRYPGYAGTARLDELRATEYAYLDETGLTYLDYTGAGLPARMQVRAHADRLAADAYGNPHSENPPSIRSTTLVADAREAVLAHFNASPDEYAVIFTPNATGACRLVGEAYPFEPGTRLALTLDNHNSVNGLREFARSQGAELLTVPLDGPDLRVAPDTVRAVLRDDRGAGPSLFAYPAQSNFTGVQHPLGWIELAHEQGWDVLLDAAAFVPTNRLDLSRYRPDFVPVSWYKVFGYPSGVGCLIARRAALDRLRRPWFSGGTIWAVSVQGGWHRLAPDESAFEDGTVSFLNVPDVKVGLEWIDGIGIDVINRRTGCLTGWLLEGLRELRHSDGRPVVAIHGPAGTGGRGPTVAMDLVDARGRVVDERAVARDAGARGIALRTGCFCNPGAGEAAYDIAVRPLTALHDSPIRTIDDYLERLGLATAGAVRVSFGVASTLRDVEVFLEFVEEAYRDRVPDLTGLPPRLRC
jgi:selenocysteine lyase/cysteine desulfurase